METLSLLLRSGFAFAAGGVIGFGFGWLQQTAAERHTRQKAAGRLRSGWSVMPGSFRRTAYLLLALGLVQFTCPLLFVGSTCWWVSAGVVGGYGFTLWRSLQRRLRSVP